MSKERIAEIVEAVKNFKIEFDAMSEEDKEELCLSIERLRLFIEEEE